MRGTAMRKWLGLAAVAVATPGLAAEPVNPLAQNAVEVRVRFICSDGEQLDVLFRNPTKLALVTVDGATQTLYQSPADKGYRYIGGETELRVDAGKASFKQTGRAAVACAVAPVQAVPGTVTGTIAYRERMALPQGATAKVEIRDISLADAPAPLIGETLITPHGNQVPLAWVISFDPAKIDPAHRYAVSARILGADGALLWVSDTVNPVLTQGGPPSDVEVALVRAAR